MNRNLFQGLAVTVLILSTGLSWPEPPKHRSDGEPPSIWVVKSTYPFQAGTEKTFDELYHGPWRARVDIVLYARPNSERVVGTIKEGTVVQALLGETIVDHPLRFTAAKDYQVVTGMKGGGVQVATLHKGDLFWILDSQNEGGFAVWWRCKVVGWDSTEAPDGDPNRLDLLGRNQEEWVKVRDPKTGLTGWFNDGPVQEGPKLVPAQATTKAAG